MSETKTKDDFEAITDRQLLVQAMGKITDLIVVVKGGFEEAVNRDAHLLSRVTAIEEDRKKASGEWGSWRDDVDARLKRNSDRATEPSSHDLDAAAKIATEITAREALAAKVDKIDVDIGSIAKTVNEVHTAAVSWYSSPTGKLVRTFAYGALVAWVATHYPNIHIPGIAP